MPNTPFGNGAGGVRGGAATPPDLTRPKPPATPPREQPNPNSIPDGGPSVFPQTDRNAGGPAKNQPATVGKPSGGYKPFRV